MRFVGSPEWFAGSDCLGGFNLTTVIAEPTVDPVFARCIGDMPVGFAYTAAQVTRGGLAQCRTAPECFRVERRESLATLVSR